MPEKHHRLLLWVAVFFSALSAYGAAPKPQDDYERGIGAVVRNKTFYKTGKFEATGAASIMPYDSLVNHYLLGGRLTWHLSDHFGWEIIDLHYAFPSVTGYTTKLVQEKGLSKLDTTELKLLASTGVVASPIYGKFHLFGSSVIYFDIYAVLGAGVAQVNTLTFSTPNTATAPTKTSVGHTDPMFNIGIGFKFFLNSAVGFVFDVRDYLTLSETYGQKSLKSNFNVSVGLSFYLPTF